jgi:hypoxanthine phosphoribosyltransferase
VKELLRHHPAEIAVAVLHDKSKEKKGSLPLEVKRYFAGRTIEDRWVTYPWDAEDIDEHARLAAEARACATVSQGGAAQ